MPLSINFRWNAPQLDKPEPEAIRSGWKDAMNSIAGTTRYLRERADKRESDRIAAEDRARRIAEEERQKKLYGDAANSIRGKMAERAALVKRREAIIARINELKAAG